MPRFVILEHDHPSLHWDLMLEAGSVLRTWRLAAPPSPETPVVAEPLADHRLVYLEYEGPVRGERGTVSRWDKGSYDGLTECDGRAEFRLEGKMVRGQCAITRASDGRWKLELLTEQN